MALDPSAEYGAQVDTGDPTGYPYGQARNVTIPGDGTGTALERKWVSDIWGFFQSLLTTAGLTPTGNPDKVGASQYQDALDVVRGTSRRIFWRKYVYEDAFCLGTNDALGTIAAFCWSGNGLKFLVRDNSEVITQYSASLPFNESTLTADSVTLDTSAQDATLEGFRYSADGTKLYTVGNTNNTIYQYTLATPWDIDTATYSTVSKSVAAQTTAPQDVAFKPDGTKMYVLASAAVYQYTLSTPWAVNTASYDTVTLSISSQETGAASIDFSDDGQLMFVMGSNGGHNLIVYDTNEADAWVLNEFTFDEYQALSPSNGGFGRWTPDGLTLHTTSEGLQLNTFACTRAVVR